jgi:hypothetical protein
MKDPVDMVVDMVVALKDLLERLPMTVEMVTVTLPTVLLQAVVSMVVMSLEVMGVTEALIMTELLVEVMVPTM